MIRLTDKGIAIIDGDTHISKWVEETGRLDHDTGIRALRQYIPVGGIVVDVGAFIGDHTKFYLDCVGPNGQVYAFEPNIEAVECLKHNCPQAHAIPVALGATTHLLKLNQFANAGASYLSYDIEGTPQLLLDWFFLPRLDFMKIDAEGWEVLVLQGARYTLHRCHPTLLIEINSGALDRAGGWTRHDIEALVLNAGYNIKVWQDNCKHGDPQYDILCTYHD